MPEMSLEQKTLAQLRAEAIKNNMKATMLSPRIENAIVADSATSAEVRHNINMLQPQTPQRLADVVQKGPFPTSTSNLMSMDILAIDAPENVLANLMEEIKAREGGQFTYKQAVASFDKDSLDTDIFTPSIYRDNPQYIKAKTVRRRLVRLILSRAEGEERERMLQWLKRTIQDVRQSFEEKTKQVPVRKGILIKR